jgi:hypothetical protein
MSEAAYVELPYLTMQNKATPTSVYHIDADGLKDNFQGLADGTAIQDKKITTRMVSDELSALITAKTPYVIELPAGSWKDVDAILETVDGANHTNLDCYGFADTYGETIKTYFGIPDDADPDGTVTFRAFGMCETASEDKVVQLQLKLFDMGSSWDDTAETLLSGDLETTEAGDGVDSFSFTETFDTLNWFAGHVEDVELERIAPSGTNHPGKWRLMNFQISIPRI